LNKSVSQRQKQTNTRKHTELSLQIYVSCVFNDFKLALNELNTAIMNYLYIPNTYQFITSSSQLLALTAVLTLLVTLLHPCKFSNMYNQCCALRTQNSNKIYSDTFVEFQFNPFVYITRLLLSR